MQMEPDEKRRTTFFLVVSLALVLLIVGLCLVWAGLPAWGGGGDHGRFPLVCTMPEDAR